MTTGGIPIDGGTGDETEARLLLAAAAVDHALDGAGLPLHEELALLASVLGARVVEAFASAPAGRRQAIAESAGVIVTQAVERRWSTVQ